MGQTWRAACFRFAATSRVEGAPMASRLCSHLRCNVCDIRAFWWRGLHSSQRHFWSVVGVTILVYDKWDWMYDVKEVDGGLRWQARMCFRRWRDCKLVCGFDQWQEVAN